MRGKRALQSSGRKSANVISVLSKYLNIIGVVAIAVSALMTGVDVLARQFFGSPIPGVYQLQEMLLVAIIGLPLAFSQEVKSHIRVDIFIGRLPPKTRSAFELMTALLALFLFGLAVWTTAGAAWRAFLTFDHTEGLIYYPTWPARTLIPIGTGCLCLRLIVDAFIHGRELFGKADVAVSSH